MLKMCLKYTAIDRVMLYSLVHLIIIIIILNCTGSHSNITIDHAPTTMGGATHISALL